MKSPAFSFYVRDWLCSKTVSKLHSKADSKLCSRGLAAYLFLLCNAWLEDPVATLPDDDDELAGMARVSPEEWKVIKPLLMPAFQKDANGRLFNERLMHEANKQLTRKQNGSKGGSQTQAKRKAALENENEVENETETAIPELPIVKPSKFEKPTIEEVKLQCAKVGLPEQQATAFWNYYESNGWRVGKNPMRVWRSALATWKINFESQKYGSTSNRPNHYTPGDRNKGTFNEGHAKDYDLKKIQAARAVPNPPGPSVGGDA